MAREARVVLPGYLHHVTQRGNYRQKIFEEDRDRIVYLKWIQENSDKYGLDIFAFCLMNNHVHFIVRPHKNDSLARVFSIAHMRYAHYVHKKHERKGHLWQGRFYSCLLHDGHVRAAVRYVERNPVRAKIVEKPWDYKWSSARAHLGKRYTIIKLADIKEYLTEPSWTQYLMGEETKEDLKEIRQKTGKSLVWGPVEFVQQLEEKLKRKLLLAPRGRPKRRENSVCP